VIDYKTQQARLFPLLASAYAFRFVGEWLKWLYTDVMKRLQANDFSTFSRRLEPSLVISVQFSRCFTH
jgi:hypothetical protein